MKFTTAQLNERCMLLFPHTHKNNRGCRKVGNRFLRYGHPEPKGNEKEEDLKAGDRIGYSIRIVSHSDIGKKVAVFTNIELKGIGDTIKEGQCRWHNLILENGGISEIHLSTGEIIREKTTKEIVNNKNK